MSVYIEKMEVYVGKHFIWLRSDARQGCWFVLIYLLKTPFCHPYFGCSNSLGSLHVFSSCLRSVLWVSNFLAISTLSLFKAELNQLINKAELNQFGIFEREKITYITLLFNNFTRSAQNNSSVRILEGKRTCFRVY